MAKSFTNGFDAKGKITEKVLSDLFAKVTPHRRSKAITHLGQNHELDVFFHLLTPKAPILGTVPFPPTRNALPHLRLLPLMGDTTFVSIHFPFRAMVRSLGFEKTGEARVVLPAEPLLTTNEETDTTTARVQIRLYELSPLDFDFHLDLGHIEWFTTSPFLSWKARAQFPQQLFEEHVEPLVIETIQGLDTVSLTPETEELKFFNFRTYVKVPDTGDWEDGTFNERFLGAFANQTILGSPPPMPANFGGPPLSGDNNLYTFIPQELLQPHLDLAAQSAITGSGGQIDSLTIELQDGFLLLSGTSPVADFNVELALESTNDGLKAHIQNVDIDLSFFLDLFEAVPFGDYIIEAIRDALSAALPGAADVATEGLETTIFSNDIETAPGAAVVLVTETTHLGFLTIRPGGVVLPGQVKVTRDVSQLQIPETVFGHRKSREFHAEECVHHKKLWKANVVIFSSPAAAFQQCFNGCAYCYPSYNIDDRDYGYLKVHVRFLDPATTNYKTTIRLTRTEPFTKEGTTTNPVLQFTASEATTDSNGNAVVIAPVDLFSGPWKVKVTRGAWSAECDAQIPARKHGNYTKVEVDVGAANCSVNNVPIP